MRIFNHDNRKKGFTLAEMLMTIAILVVLFGLIFVGVIRHQRNLKQLEMDNVAREIFVAAQNHLTADKASGEWDKFYRSAANKEGNTTPDSDAELGKPMTGTANTLNLPGIPQSQTSNHDFRVIYCKGGAATDENGNPGSGENANGQPALSRLLPEGAIDETVRNKTFVIEYDAIVGAVYSVFYSDSKGASVVYNGDNSIYTEDRRDEVDQSGNVAGDKGVQARRKNPISGYYGGTAGFLQKENGLFKPVVYIRNAESLVLYVYDFNQGYSAGANTGSQTAGSQAGAEGKADGNVSSKKLIVSVTGQTSGAEKQLVIDASGSAQKGKNWASVSYDKVDLSAYHFEDAKNGKVTPVKYAIVLDSIVRPGMHFDELFNGKDAVFTAPDDKIRGSQNPAGKTQGSQDPSGQTQGSLIPGENLSITVSLSDGGDHQASAGAFTNSLFDDVSEDDSKENRILISVSNPRHWENLSSEVSGFPQDQPVLKDKAVEYKVEVTQDLAWKTADDEDEKAEQQSVIKSVPFFTQLADLNGISKAAGKEESYPAVDDNTDPDKVSVLFLGAADAGSAPEGSALGVVNPAVTEIEGNTHRMAGFYFRAAGIDGRGNAAPVAVAGPDLVIRNLNIKDITSIAEIHDDDPAVDEPLFAASALIGSADHTKTLKVENVHVSGDVKLAGYMAGGMVGSAVISNSIDIEKSDVDGGEEGFAVAFDNNLDNCAGGLIGSMAIADGAKASVSGAWDSIYVQGAKYAGGLIGRVTGGGTLDIVESYVGGRTADGAYLGSYDYRSIGDSVRKFSEINENHKQGRFNVQATVSDNSSAGGFIGSVQGPAVSITDAYTTASVMNASEKDSSAAGGFIGSVKSGSVAADHTYTTALVYKTPKDGTYESAGTYAGYADDGSITGKCNYVLGGVTSGDIVRDSDGDAHPAASNIGLKTGVAAGREADGNLETGGNPDAGETPVVRVSFGTPDAEGKYDDDDPFRIDKAGGKAAPYDSALKDKDYPYATVAQLADMSGRTFSKTGRDAANAAAHVGDWPGVKPLKIGIDNGTALSLYTSPGTLNAGQFYAFSVTGKTSGKTGTITFRWNDVSGKTLASPLTTDAYNASLQKNQGKLALWSGEVEFDEETGQAKTGGYDHVSIDSITTADAHFADLFESDGLFPGEDITVRLFALPCRADGTTADLSGTGNQGEGSYEARTSSLFEFNGQDQTGYRTSGGYDLRIGNVRHLENLSTDISDFSHYVEEERNLNIVWNENNKAALTRAIDAGLAGLTVYFFRRNEGVEVNHTDTAGQFASIQNDTLAEFTGAQYSGSGDDRALAEYDPISNMHAVPSCDENGERRTGAGLFGSIRLEQTTHMTIRGVKLDGKAVSEAADYAGSLIGEAVTYGGKLTIRDCVVIPGKNQEVSDNIVETTGTGEGAAGGLIGSITTSQYPHITISDSAVSMYVKCSGRGGAGGLIGQIVRLDPDNNKSASLDIRNSYAGGRTSGGLYDMTQPNVQSTSSDGNSAAGGFIGINRSGEGRIENCYTTASVSSKEGYAAGFIGNNDSTEVTAVNTYTTAFVVRTGEGGNGDQSIKETDGVESSDVKAVLFLSGSSLKTGSADNYALSGVKSTAAEAKNVTWIGTASVKASASEGPFAEGQSAGAYAYDSTLGDYPYTIVTVLDGHSHIGDWVMGEDVPEDIVKNYDITVSNGNILKAGFTTDGTEEYAFLYLIGEASGSVAQIGVNKDGKRIIRILDATQEKDAAAAWAGEEDSWDTAGADMSSIFSNPDIYYPRRDSYVTDIFAEIKNDNGSRTYTLHLDDVTDNSKKFRHLFKGFYPGEDLSLFASSESLTRQDLLHISLSGAADVLPDVRLAKTNSLYDYKDEYGDAYVVEGTSPRTDDTVTAHVANIRHLSNLDYENLCTSYDANSYYPAASAIQTADIIWDNFVQETGKETVSNTDNSQWNQLAAKGFAGIKNPKLRSYSVERKPETGEYYQIRNLYSSMSRGHAGLFREVTGANFSADGITMVSPVLIGSQAFAAGAIIGFVHDIDGEVTLADCTVKSPIVSAAGNAAGGVIGYIGKSCKTFRDTGTVVSNPVASAEGDAGGYAGIADAKAITLTEVKVEYSPAANTEADNNRWDITSNAAYAGGMIGEIAGDCGEFTADGVQVIYPSATVTGSNGTDAGGFAGKDSAIYSTYRNCVTENPKVRSVLQSDSGDAGGMIGLRSATSTENEGGNNTDPILVIQDSKIVLKTLDTADPNRPFVRNRDIISVEAYENAGGVIGRLSGDGNSTLLNVAVTAGLASSQKDSSGAISDNSYLDTVNKVRNNMELVRSGELIAAVGGNSQKNAGGLIGSADGQNLSVNILACSVDGGLYGTVCGNGNAGGLAGYLNNVNFNIWDSHASVSVRADKAKSTDDNGGFDRNAGGLVGTARLGSDKTGMIERCYVSGRNHESPAGDTQNDKDIEAVRYGGNVYAGGVIGYVYQATENAFSVTDTYNTASVYAATGSDSSWGTAAAAGFIGGAYNPVSASRTYCVSHVGGDPSAKLILRDYIGSGFIGNDDGKNYYMAGISDIPKDSSSAHDDDSSNVHEDKEKKIYVTKGDSEAHAFPYDLSHYEEGRLKYPYKTVWMLHLWNDEKWNEEKRAKNEQKKLNGDSKTKGVYGYYQDFLDGIVEAEGEEEYVTKVKGYVDTYILPADKVHTGDWRVPADSSVTAKSASADAFLNLASIRGALIDNPAVLDVSQTLDEEIGKQVVSEDSSDVPADGEAVPVTSTTTGDGTTVLVPTISEDGKTIAGSEVTSDLTTDINQIALGNSGDEDAEESDIVTDGVAFSGGDSATGGIQDGIAADDSDGTADEAAIISDSTEISGEPAGTLAADPSQNVNSADLQVQTGAVLDLSALNPVRDGYRLAGWKVTEFLPADDTEMAAANAGAAEDSASDQQSLGLMENTVVVGEGTDAQPADPSMDEAQMQELAESNAAMLPTEQTQVIGQMEVPADISAQSVEVTGGEATGAAAVLSPEAAASIVADVGVAAAGSIDAGNDAAIIFDSGDDSQVIMDGIETDEETDIGSTGTDTADADLSGAFTPMTITTSVDDGLRYQAVEYNFEPGAKIQVTGDMTIEAIWTLDNSRIEAAQLEAVEKTTQLTENVIENWREQNRQAIDSAVNAGIENARSEAAQTETPAAQTETPAAQTETPAAQTETPAAQTETPAAQTETPAAQTETPAVQTETPAAQTETPAAQTETPAAQTETPVIQTETPAAQTETPVIQTEAPAAQTETPVIQTETPAAQAEMPAAQTEALAAQTESLTAQTEPPAVQEGSPLIAEEISGMQDTTENRENADATQTEME